MTDQDTGTPETPEEPSGTGRRNAVLGVGILVLAGIAFAAWQWLLPAAPPEVSRAPVAASAPTVIAPPPPEPAIANPIDTPPDAPAAATPADLEAALNELAGAEVVRSLVRLQDLPRRLVTTIDNFGRAQVSASLAPVNPPAGEFTTDRSGEVEVIAADNFKRYLRHVETLESIDVARAAQAYRRLYPLFQQAYENLGYPDKYFNDRLIVVIDQLLATPAPQGPLAVRLPQFGEDVKPERPWVLYEYQSPALQQLSAGQRMLLRMGPDNMRRVQAKLREMRREVAVASNAG